jgi:hypothetical protein
MASGKAQRESEINRLYAKRPASRSHPGRDPYGGDPQAATGVRAARGGFFDDALLDDRDS